ncbi:uncharacterized protein N7483_011530 [Penicillium malachiteum]|uniref:uncharacterized protein n=1 Tax=Penicillium malachiteum TaxID=1324776 RepID=UPI00254857C2|nr:uncharacterized protein N7483_011530 [Penicillium malachiteum]KAJ5714349.1 hypothetical protein N7483_011530 [Penicillium malachiteum]
MLNHKATTFSDIWSADDQGQNGAQYSTSSTATVPEEVVAAGTTYIAGSDGAVTLGNGDDITVPTSVAVTIVAVVYTTEMASTSTTSKSTTSTSKSETTTSTTTKKTTTSTTTTVSIPTATEFCAKYVIPNEDTLLDKYGSKYNQFIFAMWGIQWPEADHVETDIEGFLANCVAMWNNGEEYVLTSCVKESIKTLGGGTPDCEWIYDTSEDVSYSAKDSAEAEMTWIYNNDKSVISAPYPLAT